MRWLRSGQASRSVMLALFWESRWGRSAADGEAANHGAVHYRHALSLQRENALLRLQPQRDLDTGGSANGPLFAPGRHRYPPPRGV